MAAATSAARKEPEGATAASATCMDPPMELQANINNLQEHLQKPEAAEQVILSIPCNTAFLGASSSHGCMAASVCP